MASVYCPQCGTPAPVTSRFCFKCGHPFHEVTAALGPTLLALPPPPPQLPPPPLAPPPPPPPTGVPLGYYGQGAPYGGRPSPVAPATPASHTAAIVVVILIVILLVVMFVVPLPIPFSGRFTAASLGGGGSTYSQSFANGTTISGSWSTSFSEPVALVVVSTSGIHVFAGDGSTGSFSFISDGGTYQFAATAAIPVNVSISGSDSETLFQAITG